MIVYSVVMFRTDTTKENDSVLYLYMKEEDAQKKVNELNEKFRKNEEDYRAAVEPRKVQ